MKRRVLRAVVATGAATALSLALVPGTSLAAPPEERGKHVQFERFHDSGSELMAAEECPNLDFSVVYSWDVQGVERFTPQGKDQIPHFHANLSGTDTWSANGHTFTHEFRVNDKDHEIVVDGEFLVITVHAAGSDAYYVDGERVFLDTGTIFVQFRVNYNRTLDDPTDDFGFEFLGVVKPSTGRNDTAERDFCEDLATFLAPDSTA